MDISAHGTKRITTRLVEYEGTRWRVFEIEARDGTFEICCFAADNDPANIALIDETPQTASESANASA